MQRFVPLTLTGIVVIAAGTPTWKISLLSPGGGATQILAATADFGSGNNASRLVAVKIA